jgi:hypothetical protein
VIESPEGREVARNTLRRGDLAPGRSSRTFYFDPIVASVGRGYTVVLQALGTDADAAVQVLGAAGDAYPEGEATVDGRALAGDASFRYGCVRPRKVSP